MTSRMNQNLLQREVPRCNSGFGTSDYTVVLSRGQNLMAAETIADLL
jgi:hypothetical protein